LYSFEKEDLEELYKIIIYINCEVSLHTQHTIVSNFLFSIKKTKQIKQIIEPLTLLYNIQGVYKNSDNFKRK
jgi:hypothetical protein